MFTRFIRLQVPFVQLDKQGRISYPSRLLASNLLGSIFLFYRRDILRRDYCNVNVSTIWVLFFSGRCRPSIRELFSWRYTAPALVDLPIISTASEYKLANAGFAYDYQFINVEDYEGRGENSPLPHHYQNRGAWHALNTAGMEWGTKWHTWENV